MKVKLIILGLFLVLMGCQNEETIAPEQAKRLTKEHLWMVRTVEGQPLTRAVAVKDKLWQAGDTIRIKFLPGGSDSPALEAKVRQYAAEWLQYAGLYFEYVGVADSADVKIGFDLDSRYLSWSVMGTDCRMVAQDECSLNFFELGMYGEEFDRAEVLRGFGHVLGLGFEHRSPESPIVFNSRAETYFSQVCHLSEQDIAGLLTLYNTDQTNYTKYDEKSIMVLDLPRTILETPHAMISSNLELSEKDKDIIAELYPEGYDALVMMKTINRVFTMNIEHTGDIQVDWGDGCIETNVYSHTYADSIEHTIKIQGDALATNILDVANCGLTLLKIGKCVSLQELYCNHNILQNLNLSNNVHITFLACQMNQIKKLDLSLNTKLVKVLCLNNPIEELDLENNINLEYLVCSGLRIKKLDLRQQRKLTHLVCGDCLLSNLDLTSNVALNGLDCSGNEIENLDISHNLKLVNLIVYNNPFLYDSLKLLDFINSLPIRETTSKGNLTIGNGDLADQIRPLLESKNWMVY